MRQLCEEKNQLKIIPWFITLYNFHKCDRPFTYLFLHLKKQCRYKIALSLLKVWKIKEFL